jgi:hypothetical protein
MLGTQFDGYLMLRSGIREIVALLLVTSDAPSLSCMHS